jgi:hypothetical protein
MTLKQQIVTTQLPSLERVRQPRAKSWILVHIIVPMSPLLAETVVRILILFILDVQVFGKSLKILPRTDYQSGEVSPPAWGLRGIFKNQGVMVISPPSIPR